MEGLKSISSLSAITTLTILVVFAWTGSIAPASATTQVQSSVSVFLSCHGSISFSAVQAGSSCGSGSYQGVYAGIAQTVGTTQDSVFYLATANGGVKVNYSLTDLTSSKSLMSWVGFGSISGGTCTSPSTILPATQTSGSWYVINTGALIQTGDSLKASLNITFTGTGTPQFCSGGASATLISISTTAVTGSSQPILTTTLAAGRAHQANLLSYHGVAESYLNTGGVSMTALIFGVLKDSSGRSVDVLSTSISLSPGGNVTAFLPFNTYPSGSYTMTVIAVSSQLAPASAATSTSVVV